MPSLTLPKWRSHKVVEGFKIASIVYNANGGATLYAKDPAVYVEVDQKYLDRYRPEINHYYALYKDGYESLSPADAWESGYTLLSEEELTNEKIREIVLQHGFKTKPQSDGSDDLNPYVYDAVRAVVAFVEANRT